MRAMRAVALAAVLGLLHREAVADNVYLRAQAPPPSPSVCEAWCPRKTCCSFCDDPACKGCGAVKQCGMQAPAATSSTTTATKFSGRSDPAVAPGFQSGPDGFLHANGKRFHVKGINWWGSETANAVPGGLTHRTMDELLDFVSEQGFNAVRLLLNHHSVLVNGKINQGAFDEGMNPELVDLRYRDMLELVVNKAAERRLLVMVNVHQTTSTTWPGDLMWYDSRVSEAEAIRSWGILATLLCPHWNAFAADLVNEPVKASWGRGRPTDWNKAAERFGDAVLAACPRLLVMVQGVGGEPGAPNDGGIGEGYFWGENLVGAATSPVKLVDMTKLVYAPHTYGPGVYKDQPYFPPRWEDSPAFPANMVAVWDRHFGSVQQSTGRAVVLGEFGGFYTGSDKVWQDAFVTYLLERGFGSFYFGLNPDSVDTGGLLKSDWATPNDAKLALLKRLPATSVASLIGETPPVPEPPPPPPRPPHPPPPPHLSAALMARFRKPPPSPPRPSPPPPPWFPTEVRTETPQPLSHNAVKPKSTAASEILGSSNLARSGRDVEGRGTPTVAFMTLVAAATALLILLWVNPHMRSAAVALLSRVWHRAPLKLAGGADDARARPKKPLGGYGKVGEEEERFALNPGECVDTAPERCKTRGGATSQQRTAAAVSAQERSQELCSVPEAPKERKQKRQPAAKADAERKRLPAPDADAPGTDPDANAPGTEGKPLDESASLATRGLSPGQRVRIHSLKGAAHHNGKTGILIEQSSLNGIVRWNVRLDSGEKLSLRPSCLEVVGDEMEAMVTALEHAGEHEKAAVLRVSLAR